MFESFRKAALFGIGAAAMSMEKISQTIDDLVAHGDMTTDEGKKLFQDVTSNIEEQGRNLTEQIRSQIRSMLKDMGVADRSQVTMMEGRIEALERRLETYAVEMEAARLQIDELRRRLVEISQPETKAEGSTG
jgi:polyhydroxyalkanoate synthesis regulator phasin